MEEVLKILNKDPVTRKRWLDLLLEEAGAAGYGCSAVVLPAEPWSEVPRDRRLLYARVPGSFIFIYLYIYSFISKYHYNLYFSVPQATQVAVRLFIRM